MTRRPNFFLIGAPKCGTTSLADWLAQHPNVFLPYKEIHFFNSDHHTPWRPSAEEYEALFEGVDDRHAAVGDASVWYLSSAEAIPAILRYSPDARFIACVRNPIEMAYSLHNQQVFEGTEQLVRFEEAWAAQADRRQGRRVRVGTEPFHLQYGLACALGAQVERAKAWIGDRLLIVFQEDMKADPSLAFGGVLDFLVLPDFAPEFRTINRAQRRRSPFVRNAIRKLGLVKRKLRVPGSLGVLSRINSWNRVEQEWRPDAATDQMLRDWFADDIARLSAVTGRDLSHWLTVPPENTAKTGPVDGRLSVGR